MRRKILIDTDPGIDDALAILMAFASEALEVVGITTVAGNVDIHGVTRNALSLAAMAGSAVPVSAGAEGPLVGKRMAASHVHGENGTGNVVLPSPARAPDPRPAIDLIRDLADAHSGELDLVCLGPLTNLAMALTAYPRLRKGAIRRIYIMGGSAGLGNATAAAEFNIIADPHAAACVFQAGIPITMCGLDVTNGATFSQADLDRMRSTGKVGSLCAAMLQHYLQVYHGFGFEDLALHDAVPVAAAIEAAVIGTKACHVEVETDGEYTTGKTVVDVLGVAKLAPNADVAFSLDLARFKGMVMDLVAGYDKARA